MISGDNRQTAEAVGRELGIDRVLAEVLPQDKADYVTRLQQEGKKVAMVGDGVNDAPALAQADVGIAIGAGTDVAVETANVVLMRSDPLDIASAMQLSRATVRKMKQNLGCASVYNVMAIPIAAGVLFPSAGIELRPEWSALLMSVSSIIVATNAVLLKRVERELPGTPRRSGSAPRCDDPACQPGPMRESTGRVVTGAARARSSTEMSGVARCLILGAGFGGLAAAHELRASLGGEHRVTVVAHADSFFAGLAKLWDIVGLRPLEQGSRPLARLRERGIEFVQAEITGIDPDRRSVETTGGVLKGDYLMVALGASFDPAHVRQLEGSAHNLYDAAALPGIRRDLEALDRGTVVVAVLGAPYKCPPAPYEATLLIDDWLRRRGRRDRVAMTVFTAQPSALPVAGPEASAEVARTLEQRGIAFHSDHKPAGVERNAIRFDNGRVERFDVLLAVPRHVAPPVVADSPLAGPSDWIEPDPRTLRTSFDGVYAVGDCISVPLAKGQLPKAGVFAEAHGRVAARNIVAEIQGGAGAEFDGRGYCFMELGDGSAAYVEGDFFAEPAPDVRMSEPDEESFRAKQAFERERLDAWL